MARRAPAIVVVVIVAAAVFAVTMNATGRVQRLRYSDIPSAIQKRFAADGIDESRFAAYLREVDAETGRRVAEGEREHFIYYALQSKRFTSRPAIEPAVSARRFVEALGPDDRRRLLDDGAFLPRRGWPDAERARMNDALTALGAPGADERLATFDHLRRADGARLSLDALYPDYVRVVRFLYLKEFSSGAEAPAIAALYRQRPHSSDTQIEAGFAVYQGLGTLRALDPGGRIRRVLIVGPGLDLAPRTDLIDAVGPQMYQPFAVADALLALPASSETELTIDAVDVNPRVVRFAQAVNRTPATLHLFTVAPETEALPFSGDYRAYVRSLGRAIGEPATPPRDAARDPRYLRSIVVRPAVTRAIRAERVNIVTERLAGSDFDLVVITNVLTYFTDPQLTLALANIAAMLRPGGWLLHNESRAGLAETGADLQLPVVHMRTAVLGGPPARPWYDTVWLHQKTRT